MVWEAPPPPPDPAAETSRTSDGPVSLGPRRRSLHPLAANHLPPSEAGGFDHGVAKPSLEKRRSSVLSVGGEINWVSDPTAIAFTNQSPHQGAGGFDHGVAKPSLGKRRSSVLSVGSEINYVAAGPSAMAFAPDEGTPPEACVRPANPLLKRRVSWAPGTPSPMPSRERLHKRARGLSDQELEENGYE